MSEAVAIGPAASTVPATTLRSGIIRILLVVTFAYPVIVCAAFFPTPAGDLREHINLGLAFPFYTWNNPPLQTWIAGAIAALGARDSWAFVLVAQVLNGVGLVYLVATAERFIGRYAVVPLVIIYCGSIYYSLATPSMALNADQIQVPIWAAILYHALAASDGNRWRDWLASGVLFGIAVLAKYYAAIILAAFLAAALCEPAYRRMFSNARFYVAGLVSLPIIAVNAVPEFLYGEAVGHGLQRFDLFDPAARGSFWQYFLPNRATALWHLFRSLVFYGAPALAGLALLAWRGNVSAPRMPSAPAKRLIVFAAGAVLLAMLLLIVIGGLRFSTRYGFVYDGLCILALLCVIEIRPASVHSYANIMLGIWAAIILGTLVYSLSAINRPLREPAPAAAAELRALWDREFACGPAYIIGDFLTAHGIAIYARPRVRGVAFDELVRTSWYSPEEAARHGAIVIATPELAQTAFRDVFAGKQVGTLALPYRRTWQASQHHYVYFFRPPLGCPAAIEGQ